MVSRVEELLVRYKADTTGLTTATDKANIALNKFKTTATTAGAGVTSSFTMMKSALMPLMSAFAVLESIRMADQFALLQARVQNATSSTEEFNMAFTTLKNIASETGSALETSVSVFQRLSLVKQDLKASTEQMLSFTDSVQKLGVLSGAGTASLNAGLMQLGQGLGAGILRAEEFNSLVENTPMIVTAIADAMGITGAKLRTLVIDGKVLSEDVFTAILSQTEKINADYEKFPKTVGRAFNELKLNAMGFVGELSKSSGASTILVKILEFASSLMKRLALDMRAISLGWTMTGLVAKQVINDIAVNFSSFVSGAQTGIESLSRGFIKFKEKGLGVVQKDYTDQIKATGEEIASLKGEYETMRVGITATSETQKVFSGDLQVTQEKADALKEKYQKMLAVVGDTKEKAKSIDMATKALEAMNDQTVKNRNEMADFLASSMDGFSSLRETALNALKDIAKNMLRVTMGGQAGDGLTGALGGFLGSAVTGLMGGANSGAISAMARGAQNPNLFGPGFATGGSFTVGGSGGTDTQPVGFMATRGEKVTIETPSQQNNNRSDGSTTIINQNLNFSTGIQSTVRAEVLSMLPLIERQSLSAVKQASARGKM